MWCLDLWDPFGTIIDWITAIQIPLPPNQPTLKQNLVQYYCSAGSKVYLSGLGHMFHGML